jgi:RNA polymerase sigma-70 factor (ECF subfamily)
MKFLKPFPLVWRNQNYEGVRSFADTMESSESNTTDLLRRASQGDSVATQQLFTCHRDQLKRMVAVRMDPRVAARFDPSDVVQEALLVAARRLPQYFQERPLPFYPWLRQLAWDRLVELHRRHLSRQRRSVGREVHDLLPLTDGSLAQLIDRLADNGTNPSSQLMRKELQHSVHEALKTLPEKYREVLVLRHLEQLSVVDTADVLGVTPSAVKTRYYRAIQRMHDFLQRSPEES